MGLLTRWAIGAVALYLTVLLGDQLGFKLGFTGTGAQSVIGAFVAVLVLTLVNALIRPVVKLLTLPLSCITFGLFGLVINALMFYLVGQLDVGLKVDGLIAALFGSVVTSVLFGVLNTFLGEGKKRDE
ncbi:MAG: phage holin family protein [Akkermansiaceae bacterium]|nr:phage holin family protein [Armatimonadota bacterium]